MIPPWIRSCVYAALLAGTAARAQDFALRDGDVVVFYGDSITERRVYTAFIETYVATRFPGRQVRFYASGWSGEQSIYSGGGPIDVRLSRDVASFHPTVVTVLMGMNDGHYAPFDQSLFDLQTAGYRHIIDTLRDTLPDARVVILQPSPFDDFTRPPSFDGGYNSVLLRYGQFQADLAAQRGLLAVDLNQPLVAVLKAAYVKNPDVSTAIISDRIHPDPSGSLVLAAAILKAWNAPSEVTDVEIDASTTTVIVARNSTVSGLQKGSALSWVQLDQALPLPIDGNDPATTLALSVSNIWNDINRQVLKVSNLEPGDYQLTIDTYNVGIFSAKQLGDGINLASLSTPMSAQAAQVQALTVKHGDIHFTRWRNLQLPFEADAFPHYLQALDSLDSLEADALAQRRLLATPVPRSYQLAPLP